MTVTFPLVPILHISFDISLLSWCQCVIGMKKPPTILLTSIYSWHISILYPEIIKRMEEYSFWKKHLPYKILFLQFVKKFNHKIIRFFSCGSFHYSILRYNEVAYSQWYHNVHKKSTSPVRFRKKGRNRRKISLNFFTFLNFKKARKTEKNEENPRKSRVLRLASFKTETLERRFLKRHFRKWNRATHDEILTPFGWDFQPTASDEIKSASPLPTKRDFIAKRFHPPQADLSSIGGFRWKKHLRTQVLFFGGTTRNRTGGEAFAELCLTAWLWCRACIFYQNAKKNATVLA